MPFTHNRSIPDPTVVPILPYPDVREAVDWLIRVFGFRERLQIAEHRAQMNIPNGGAMIVAEYIDCHRRPKPNTDHVSHKIMVRVEDAQAHYEHSVSCGALILQPPVDHVYGERQYEVQDIGGHRWTFSQTLADIHPNEWGNEDIALKIP
jgi:uncharacterized glyoxalase superfamily protein PhnB